MDYFEVVSRTRTEMLDVTREVETAVAASGIEMGICCIYVPHTTAAVTVNEGHDPDVVRDILKALSDLVPAGDSYAHAEGNADAHIKATLVGSSARVPVQRGGLALGRWQRIFFCEFDGPRHRRVGVSVVADS